MQTVSTSGRPFLLALLFLACCSLSFAQPAGLDRYNVIWTSQSKNSSESMPCGGGDIGVNVWVENGELLLYFSRSGSFDENNSFLKLGRVRLQISPDPFSGGNFKQELKLADGSVLISGKNTQVRVWVDVFRPVIHVDIQGAQASTATAAYESWRYEDHLVQGPELRSNSYKAKQPFDVITYRDSMAFRNNEVIFFHRNRADVTDIFEYTVEKQGMGQVKDEMYDPIRNNTSGGVLKGTNMKPAGMGEGTYADTKFRSWKLESARPSRTHQLEIGLHIAQAASAEDWTAGLDSIMKASAAAKKTAQARSREWWRQFWNRSYVFIEGKDSAVSRNYQLFRYQLGCNAYGKWPTKSNGGLFTFDPGFVNKDYSYTPDFQLWGGGTMTAQNQRLVYFPMIKSGDFDMLRAQFNVYLNAQKNAELRSRVYWNHNGACFTEQMENFGLPNITEYSLRRPVGYDPGMEYNAWLEYEWDTVFEFCLMMLETERYEGRDITSYIPFIESCLAFFDEHYQQLAAKRGTRIFDENGYYVFYPGSAAETFKMTYNSSTTISALKVVLGRLLELPAKYLDTTRQSKWSTMLKRIPPLPFRYIDGRKILAPAEAWARVQNTETPQLYPVFPWGIYGVGKPDLDVAIQTYKYDPHSIKYRSHVGWRQYNIFAARLGLVSEAEELNRLKFGNSPNRFPTFWGPGFDWTPDHNWGGAAMTGLQEMLMQVDDKKIYLLPAWPKDWNARFKLHAPYNTIVEGTVKDGRIDQLKVTPETRKKDVIFMETK